MAEFCLECFNKLHDTNYTEKQVTMADDFCEGCGHIKPCIILLRAPNLISKIIKAITQSIPHKLISIKRNGNKYIIKGGEKNLTLDSGSLTVQDAYIHLYGAIGTALDDLSLLEKAEDCPSELHSAVFTLQQAINETDTYVEII